MRTSGALRLGLWRRWRGRSRGSDLGRCGYLGSGLSDVGCTSWLDGPCCRGHVAHIDRDEYLRWLGGRAVTAELEDPEEEEEEDVASHSHQGGDGSTAWGGGIGLWHEAYWTGSLSARVARTTLREA